MTDIDARAANAGLPPFASYPPAPWHARGRCWASIFRADAPAGLPPRLKSLLDSRLRAVALIRYEAGSTLCYDELLIGLLAHHGLRCGIYVEHIYVDSVPSLWGGREIWGLPKRLAAFTWRDGRCRVSDEAGTIATLRVDTRSAKLPIYAPLAAPAFGLLKERPAHLVAPVLARLGRCGMLLEEWSPRFPYRLGSRPLLRVAAKPFHARFPVPVMVQ
ncbi:MAG TPA: acetoacetate decarboxylase family protein [Ktedonobacterales bacterium]|nr:acetoacetate decarboxylase family protein [Ktedonobacterales bacterium]